MTSRALSRRFAPLNASAKSPGRSLLVVPGAVVTTEVAVVGDGAPGIDHSLRGSGLDDPELLRELGFVAVGVPGERRRRAVGGEVGEPHAAGVFAAGRFANG